MTKKIIMLIVFVGLWLGLAEYYGGPENTKWTWVIAAGLCMMFEIEIDKKSEEQ